MTPETSAALIFAAGFGTRMGDLTRNVPKPMLPVAGKPLVGHSIDLARDAGVGRLVANTHFMPEIIEPYLRSEGVAISRETPDILDTGGGLRQALPLLGDGPAFTLNSDTIWHGENPFPLLADAWRPDMGALLLCVPIERAVGRTTPGDFSIDPDGRLDWGGSLVYTGAQIMDPAELDPHSERSFSLREVWMRLSKERRLHGIRYTGDWVDVGHPEGITLAESLLADV